MNGWAYVRTSKKMQSAAGVERVIDKLAVEDVYDFVSPVFLGEGGLPYIPTRDLLVKRTDMSNQTSVELLLQNYGEILDVDFSGMDNAKTIGNIE